MNHDLYISLKRISYTFEHADLSVYGGIGGILSSTGTFDGAFQHINVSGTTDTPDFVSPQAVTPIASRPISTPTWMPRAATLPDCGAESGATTADPPAPSAPICGHRYDRSSANISTYRSVDGGKNFKAIKGAPGGDDYHTVWINPENPQIIGLAVDQGATISVNGGQTWSSWYNQPTAQLYHAIPK